MNEHKDTIYSTAQDKVSPFRFDAKVAAVFSDMISRSVPSYQPILEMLPTITRRFRMPDHNYYDLGCSLGAGLHAMAEGLKPTPGFSNLNASLIGIDNSSAMLKHAKAHSCPYDNLTMEFVEQSLLDTQINRAAMVLMNFTLQFIDVEQRQAVISNIYQGLSEGGALILSEKVSFADATTDQTMIDIHHQYKADQGYSRLEISQKRDAIENVLIPETLDTHTQRLKHAGFKVITPWLQNLQFLSILAVK